MEMRTQKKQSRLLLTLTLVVVGMFAFGFLLVPLYDVICRWTGLNGKTAGQYELSSAEAVQVDQSRLVTVQFVATNNDRMSWEFRPMVASIQLHPGEVKEVKFYARNPEAKAMTAQAIPSVSPGATAEYLHKVECFCFAQQHLMAGQAVEMPLRFFVDPKLPAHVTKLTLSYTLFDVDTLAHGAEARAQQSTN
jgi:cytochrome c oxidase assembly protein subunit 11